MSSDSEDYTEISTDDSDESSMSELSENSESDVTLANGTSTETGQTSNKVTKSMQDILKDMVKQRRLLDEQEMILTFAAWDVDEEYDKNNALELFDTPTDNLKVFASFLHLNAPRTYEYIRDHYNTPLPSIEVLGSWCRNDKFQPGFTKQAFDILKTKSAEKGGRLICSLVADTFQLFVPDHNEDAYVILIVSLEEKWKIPVCYFMSDQICKETNANLIKMCLHLTNDVGVDVVSVTTTKNVGQILGCKLEDHKKLETTFNHPASGNPVAVFIDPTLSLRSLYQIFNSKREILNGKKETISVNYLMQLENFLTNKRFQFDFSNHMLELRNILAKIDLVSELMTPSVAAALEICKNRLKLPSFANAGPTIEYLTMINTLYYILYSKVGQSGFRQAISQENGQEILEFLDEAKKYISAISYAKPGVGRSGRQVAVQDQSFMASGFNGLQISIETLKHLYISLVQTGILNCLPTYKLSWDHMDEFFHVILKHNPRQHGRKFPAIYQRFFEDLKPTLTDCLQIESYRITNLTKPLDIIKKSSGKRTYDEQYSVVSQKRRKTEDEKRADTNVSKFVKHLEKEQDRIDRKLMVGYIAGWISVQLAKTLQCEDCIDALHTNEKQWFHKYITRKELKGLCLPSEELFKICWECERAIRGQSTLDCSAERRLLSRSIHIPEASHRNHHIHLTKAVLAKYLRLRLGLGKTRNWLFF